MKRYRRKYEPVLQSVLVRKDYKRTPEAALAHVTSLDRPLFPQKVEDSGKRYPGDYWRMRMQPSVPGLKKRIKRVGEHGTMLVFELHPRAKRGIAAGLDDAVQRTRSERRTRSKSSLSPAIAAAIAAAVEPVSEEDVRKAAERHRRRQQAKRHLGLQPGIVQDERGRFIPSSEILATADERAEGASRRSARRRAGAIERGRRKWGEAFDTMRGAAEALTPGQIAEREAMIHAALGPEHVERSRKRRRSDNEMEPSRKSAPLRRSRGAAHGFGVMEAIVGLGAVAVGSRLDDKIKVRPIGLPATTWAIAVSVVGAVVAAHYGLDKAAGALGVTGVGLGIGKIGQMIVRGRRGGGG